MLNEEPTAIRRRRAKAESTVMRPQTSKDEAAVNVESSIGGMRKQGEWLSGLKGSDEVSEVVREHRPDASGKSPVTLSKASLNGVEVLSI
jgi:hypothetical protein